MKKRDLRAELLAAEAEARDKKRKAEGKPPLAVENGAADEEANKRRRLLQEALEMDKDEDDEDGVLLDRLFLGCFIYHSETQVPRSPLRDIVLKYPLSTGFRNWSQSHIMFP